MIYNDTYLIHFCIKKRLFIILFLVGLLLTSFYFGFISQNFSYNSNVYIFNTSNLEFKNINLSDNYNKSTLVNNKIAPGVSGNFSIVVKNDTNENIEYSFVYKENDFKPQRFIF